MKKVIKIILLIVLVLLLVWPVYYFVTKKEANVMAYHLERPETRMLKNFVMCSGIVLPKEEVEIKSRISGVLEAIYVNNGDRVRKNQVIAKISVIPDMETLAASESDVRISKLNFDNQTVVHNRNKILLKKGIIAKADFEKTENAYLNAKAQLQEARKRYRIVKSGNYSNTQTSNTSIVSTIDGVVTLLPTKIGASIIQSNNFNAGTTIAKIANIEEMVFKGNVKEYEVSKLSKGMDVIINAAITDQDQKGVLSEISTSGSNKDGMILFEIKSTLANVKTEKTGFSANAKIVTEARNATLAIKEEWIEVKGDSIYVEVNKNENETEKRAITLGLSDGIYTEVVSGLTGNELIRVYDK